MNFDAASQFFLRTARQIVIIGFLNYFGLIFMMIFRSIGVSEIENIPLVTSVLEFIPGGVAEMVTASLSLNTDLYNCSSGSNTTARNYILFCYHRCFDYL